LYRRADAVKSRLRLNQRRRRFFAIAFLAVFPADFFAFSQPFGGA